MPSGRPPSLLTRLQIQAIVDRLNKGERASDLGREFYVAPSAIRHYAMVARRNAEKAAKAARDADQAGKP